jgi:hypothetical protein
MQSLLAYWFHLRGLTASARALAQACAPVVSGVAMATAATPLPFVLAGALKILHDLSLFFRFRSVPLAAAPGGPPETPRGIDRRAARGVASPRRLRPGAEKRQ